MQKKSGNRNLVIGLLALVGACACVALIAIAIGLSTGITQVGQSAKATQVLQNIVTNPETALSVVRIQSGTTLRGCDIDVCGSNFSAFKITNQSSINIGIECSQTYPCGSGNCESKQGWGYDGHLAPGASQIIYCTEDSKITPPDVCFSFYPEYQYGNYLGQWCLNGKDDQFYLRGSEGDKSSAATATALWNQSIKITSSIGRFASLGNDIYVRGTITNNTSQKLTILNGAEAYHGTKSLGYINCYDIHDKTNDIPSGGELEYYCYNTSSALIMTDIDKVCFGFNTENGDSLVVCSTKDQ